MILCVVLDGMSGLDKLPRHPAVRIHETSDRKKRSLCIMRREHFEKVGAAARIRPIVNREPHLALPRAEPGDHRTMPLAIAAQGRIQIQACERPEGVVAEGARSDEGDGGSRHSRTR
jgi:hypothetical protein